MQRRQKEIRKRKKDFLSANIKIKIMPINDILLQRMNLIFLDYAMINISLLFE